MKHSISFKLFYTVVAGALLFSFFLDRNLGYGLIVGAVVSYISTVVFKKQQESYTKTKKLPIFLTTFFIKYIIIACLLYFAMRYNQALFKGCVIGFVLNQIVLLMERIRSQKHDDSDN